MADYEGSATYYNAKVYNSSSNTYVQDVTWLGAGLSYEINKSDDGTYYDLDVWARFESQYEMEAKSQSKACKYYVYLNGPGIDEDGEDIGISGWQDSPDWSGKTKSDWVKCGSKRLYQGGTYKLWVKIDLDNYVGQIDTTKYSHGIAWQSKPGYVFRFLQSNYTGDIALPSLIVAPSISELSLKNPKTGSSTVANSSSEISITASRSGGDDYTKWETWIKGPGRMGSDNGGEYYEYVEGDYFNNHYDTFHSLRPRTEYSFAARMHNSAGNSGWTGTKTYRTLSDPPAMSAKAKSKTLNSVTFTWTSNYDLNKVYYQYKTTGNWSSEYSQGIDGKKTGDITISGIAPNTTVYIRVKGTENWDDQTSSYPENAHASQTTYDIASTEISTSIIHSGTVNLANTKNPSGNTMTLVMYDGNDTIASWNIATNTSSVSLSESQWDNVYKRYGNSNTKNYSFYLYTANDGGTWNSYNRNVARTVTLTGIQKTAHVGNNGAKRAMVWYSVNGVMKHAVVWVGAGGGTKRTI